MLSYAIQKLSMSEVKTFFASCPFDVNEKMQKRRSAANTLFIIQIFYSAIQIYGIAIYNVVLYNKKSSDLIGGLYVFTFKFYLKNRISLYFGKYHSRSSTNNSSLSTW